MRTLSAPNLFDLHFSAQNGSSATEENNEPITNGQIECDDGRKSSMNSCSELFVHVKDYACLCNNVYPFCKTEVIYLPLSRRSEEPVTSNMDISTGHIVLVCI